MLLLHDNLLHTDENIRVEVGHAFNDLLVLVRDVSIYYYAQVNAISAGQVSLDFNSTFGGHIEAFHKRKTRITDAMWQIELGDDAPMDVETLRAWLRPRDRSLQTLVKNRFHAPGHRDEYTCEWFQRHLLDFSRSKKDGLSIVGPAGCGKSVLSRWIVERLQRPLGKRSFETLFFTIGRSFESMLVGLLNYSHAHLYSLYCRSRWKQYFRTAVSCRHLNSCEQRSKPPTTRY